MMEPDWGDRLRQKMAEEYDQHDDVTPATGFIDSDGRGIQMGPGDRYEDHRALVPTVEEMRKYGWPEDVIRHAEEHTRTPGMYEAMKRSRLVRFHLGEGYMRVEWKHDRLTSRQRQAIKDAALTYRPKTVELYGPNDEPEESGWEDLRLSRSEPKVDWNVMDNDGLRTKESIKKNHNVAHSRIFKQSVPLEHLYPVIVERENARQVRGMSPETLEREYGETDMSPYDYAQQMEDEWEERKRSEYARPFGRGYPPILVRRVGESEYEILDGNHRVETWQDQGYESAPAWVIDDWGHKNKVRLSRDEGPEGWITPEGVFHQNDMSLPFGSRHEATLMAHDLKHGEAVRLGWMHVGSPDDVQVLGHHPDLAYTAPQLRTLKKLAAKSNRTPAITSKSNGVYTTRELKLAREDIAALKGLVAQAPSDPQAHLMLAEALEAHGHPRLAGLLMHPGGEWTRYPWSSSYRGGIREYKTGFRKTRGTITHPLIEGVRIYPGGYRGTRHLELLFHHAPGVMYRIMNYPLREYKSAEDEVVNLSRRELSGWVSPTGEFTKNEGEVSHGDTAYILLTQKHGYPEDVRNVEQLLHREGYMHVSDGEDGFLYGHHPDRQYQAPQLTTLKRLARENGFTKAAVTNDVNGRLGTRELKLSMEKPEHLGDPVPEDNRFEESIRFTVPGSGTYDVALSKPSPWSKKRDLVFDRVDRDGPPPQNPNKVFAHVAHGALQLLRKHNRHPVVIEAGSPGLVKLYERLMDRLPDHLPGWAVSRGMDEGGGYGVWQLTPPSLKLGALRRMEGYNGWVDPEGQFYLNPENGTADHEFGARRIVPHGQDLPWASDHLESKGWMKVWAWKHLPELLYGHHPKYQYTSAQVSALKRLARKGGFTTVSITTKVNGSPGTRELKLARQKAPAGGMIVNNQFFKGGKFLPRALESIRKMRGHIALARVPLPEGAFGQKTLTDAQIRDIENHHGLEEHERLPRTVNPDGTVSTSIEHLAPFFDRLAKKVIGPEKHAAILADDGVSDDVKFYHLLTHAHDSANDYLSAVARSGTEWYGSSVAQLDRGLKVIFGRERPGDPTSKPDPKKWTPAHAKLFKMLLALTSYNTAPINNTKNAIAALLAGYRHGPHAPFENIPDANHESLAPYKDLPPPGTAISDRLKWQEKYGEKKNPGYMSAPVRLANGKVVGLVNMDSTVRWLAPGFDKTNTKPGLIPITDETGALRPKTWGSMGVDRVRKFKEFISRAGSYQKAARILEREWTPAQLKQMFNLKAINRGDLEPGAKIPGSFAFGPKFGAFFQNLRGEKSRIAMDKWYSRTMARLVGNLIGNGKLVEIPDGPRTRRLWKRVGEAVAKRLGIPPADMQAVLWYYEQNLWRLFGAKNQSEDFADGIRQALKTHGFTK